MAARSAQWPPVSPPSTHPCRRPEVATPHTPLQARLAIGHRTFSSTSRLFAQDKAKLSPEQTQTMMTDLRKSRGLGPVRFADLLARNAKLRALVRPQVEVAAEEVDQSLAAEFGPKARVRILTAPTQRRAAELREAVVKSDIIFQVGSCWNLVLVLTATIWSKRRAVWNLFSSRPRPLVGTTTSTRIRKPSAGRRWRTCILLHGSGMAGTTSRSELISTG